MAPQRRQRARFVRLHQARISRNIGAQQRRQPPSYLRRHGAMVAQNVAGGTALLSCHRSPPPQIPDLTARRVRGRTHRQRPDFRRHAGKASVEAREDLAFARASQMQRVGEVHALPGPVEGRLRGLLVLGDDSRQREERAQGVENLLARDLVVASQHPLGLQQNARRYERVE
jgi:hypothetical protein